MLGLARTRMNAAMITMSTDLKVRVQLGNCDKRMEINSIAAILDKMGEYDASHFEEASDVLKLITDDSRASPTIKFSSLLTLVWFFSC
jgi:hypothetical protein